jgi:phenylacetic acid degradation operon negative regulatory protein
MKPRSLILDIFGDYLRFVGSEVRASDLGTLLGALGVEAATTRMTLSRLKQEHWFTTAKVGRETFYRLSPEMLEVLDEGRERIFAPYQSEWDGWWTQVVYQLPESDRAVREQLKKRLAWLGFGPLTPSTWLSPRRLRMHSMDLRAEFPTVTSDVLESRTDDVVEDRSLVRRCWDLTGLNRDYADFIERHRDLLRAAPTFNGHEAFAARIEIVSTYRHFPFRDPSLPRDLRPDGWLGGAAKELFLDIHDALAPAAIDYVSEVIGTRVDVPLLASENM